MGSQETDHGDAAEGDQQQVRWRPQADVDAEGVVPPVVDGQRAGLQDAARTSQEDPTPSAQDPGEYEEADASEDEDVRRGQETVATNVAVPGDVPAGPEAFQGDAAQTDGERTSLRESSRHPGQWPD